MCRKKKWENVNGTTISLTTTKEKNLEQFIVSFGSAGTIETSKKTSTMLLLLAVLVNILGFIYIKLSLTLFAVIGSTFAFLTFFWMSRTIQSETVTIIPCIGIQSSIQYVFGCENNYFKWDDVDDIIINEVIQYQRVLFYLTLLIKEDNKIKLIPLFKNTKPRLNMIEVIYNGIQKILHENTSKKPEAGDN